MTTQEQIRKLIEREAARMEKARDEGNTVAAKGAEENLRYLWQQLSLTVAWAS